MRQRNRNDEAERFKQFLTKVVVETRRHAAERRQLMTDRLDDARMPVAEQRGAAGRGEIQVLAFLVIPHVSPIASVETKVARAVTQLVEPPIWKHRGHPCNLRYVR